MTDYNAMESKGLDGNEGDQQIVDVGPGPRRHYIFRSPKTRARVAKAGARNLRAWQEAGGVYRTHGLYQFFGTGKVQPEHSAIVSEADRTIRQIIKDLGVPKAKLTGAQRATIAALRIALIGFGIATQHIENTYFVDGDGQFNPVWKTANRLAATQIHLLDRLGAWGPRPRSRHLARPHASDAKEQGGILEKIVAEYQAKAAKANSSSG